MTDLKIATIQPVGVISQSALDPAEMSSGSATLGQAPLADGAGGIAWGDIAVADRVGWLRIVDVTPTNVGDTVSAKVYDDPPGNTLLQSATSSSGDVTLLIESSFPRVTIGATTHTLPLIPTAGLYRDTVAITLAASGDVVASAIDPDGNAAASDTVALTLDLPPVISAAIFTGGYPGSQTELKAGDTYQINVVADKSFDSVVISDYGAGRSSTVPVAAGISATVSLTAADRGNVAQLLGARVAVLDTVTGASSATYDTDSAGSADGVNVVSLNNLYPTATWGSPTYPGAQGALKGVESATVPVTLADLDTVLFDDDGSGEVTVVGPTTIATPKTVTRAGGTYNISTDNLRVSANRAANDATTVAKRNVAIANVAANVTVSPPAARLRSGGNDATAVQNHVITLSADQELAAAPTLNQQATFGAFAGSWTGGPSTWTRTLQVADTDAKGVGTWQGLVATNLAGIVQNTVGTGSTYTLGGFVARDLTFAAFATTTTLNVEVVTFAKLTAGVFTATNQTAIKQAIGTAPPVTNGYTINSLAVNPTTLTWLDTAAAGTNSTGSAQILAVEEVV